jgi:hypothetical protein
MAAALQLNYTYRYAQPSAMARQGDEWGLRLATFGGASSEQAEHPFFFDGRVLQPHVAAGMLLTLAKVVSTRFWMPLNPALLDPVVTSSEEMLRFEGFSSCCGVYARADLGADMFESDIRKNWCQFIYCHKNELTPISPPVTSSTRSLPSWLPVRQSGPSRRKA